MNVSGGRHSPDYTSKRYSHPQCKAKLRYDEKRSKNPEQAKTNARQSRSDRKRNIKIYSTTYLVVYIKDTFLYFLINFFGSINESLKHKKVIK